MTDELDGKLSLLKERSDEAYLEMNKFINFLSINDETLQNLAVQLRDWRITYKDYIITKTKKALTPLQGPLREWDQKACVVCNSPDIERFNLTLPTYKCRKCNKTYWLKQITLTLITSEEVF